MRSSLLAIAFSSLCFSDVKSQCPCEPLGPSTGIVITVDNVSELDAALSQASTSNGNLTIELNPGTYTLTSNLLFISPNMSNLTIRGATGNRENVIIKGQGWDDNSVTHIFNIAADHFTVADMTIGEVYYHPIQVHSNPNDADYFLAQNVRFYDAKEQLLKVSGGGDLLADSGRVECCLFEFTGGVAYQWYTGGIDAHRSRDWIVKNNVFKHIRSPDSGLAEHAIHFWRESSGTHVESNQIINCDRGIGFGLGSDVQSGHTNGIILNNFVHTSRDVGIGLESAPGAKVYNNTVITENYFNSIEYRFAATSGVHITNCLVNEAISDRNSGSSGLVESNFTVTDMGIFQSSAGYDYHLAGQAAGITDAGLNLPELNQDYDCEARYSGSGVDIGADELGITTSHDLVLEELGLQLYPNPTEGKFVIDGMVSDYAIEVLDASGQVYQTYNQATGPIEIDLSALPAGLYFVKVSSLDHQLLSIQLILKSY